MTPREAGELIERMARALCKHDVNVDPDAPFFGLLPTVRGQYTDLTGLLDQRWSVILPMWTYYAHQARTAAVAAGLLTWDEPADYGSLPQWVLMEKEAKDQD